MLRLLLIPAALVLAAASPPDGVEVHASRHDFTTLVERTAAAAEQGGLAVIGRASASAAAAKRGVTIPGDAVLMVFNNQYAVRLLKANPLAGIEPPLHLHIAETSDGGAAISYRLPSATFRPYGDPSIDAVGAELDKIFSTVVAKAVAP